MLYNCEKAKGSLGRGSQAAAIGQLLPQMVPAWLQLLGLTASRGSALGPHLGTIPAGSLCWSQSSCHDPLRTGPVGAGDDPGVLTATSTPVPFSPPGLMAELCLPRQGLVGAGGGQRSLGSSSQAPAAVFSRVKVQCFEIFYFEWQSWRSGVAPDPRVSVRSGAGSRAGWVQGGCCPWEDVVAPGSSPHGCPRGPSHLRLYRSLFPCSPISHTLPREDGLSSTGMSFLLSLLQQDPDEAPEQDVGCRTPAPHPSYPTVGCVCGSMGPPWHDGTATC